MDELAKEQANKVQALEDLEWTDQATRSLWFMVFYGDWTGGEECDRVNGAAEQWLASRPAGASDQKY